MTEGKYILNFRYNNSILDQKFHISKTLVLTDFKILAIESLNIDPSVSDFINFYHNGLLLSNENDYSNFNEEAEVIIDVVLESPVFSAPSGRVSGCLLGHSEAILICLFSPCGNFLASGAGDGCVRFWDIQTKTPLKCLKIHNHWIQSLSWSIDGAWVSTGSLIGEIFLIRVSDYQVFNIKSKSKSAITFISWSKFDKFLFSFGTNDGAIGICDSRNLSISQYLSGHDLAITSLQFHKDGILYSSSRDCYVKAWNKDGTLSQKSKFHSHWVNDIILCNNFGVSCSEDGTLVKFELKDFKNNLKLVGHQGPICQIILSPNKKFIASCSFDKSIKIWDAESGNYIKTLRGHTGPVYRISWNPNSNYIASVSRDSTLKIWDSLHGKIIRQLSDHKDEIYCLDWSLKGVVATGGKDRTLRLWD